MKSIVVLCLIAFLAGCTGPVFVARNEAESLKTDYRDPQLASMSQKYQVLLKEIYARCQKNHMSVAKEGLGFTSLTDNKGKRLNYLLVQMRPEERISRQAYAHREGRKPETDGLQGPLSARGRATCCPPPSGSRRR